MQNVRDASMPCQLLQAHPYPKKIVCVENFPNTTVKYNK